MLFGIKISLNLCDYYRTPLQRSGALKILLILHFLKINILSMIVGNAFVGLTFDLFFLSGLLWILLLVLLLIKTRLTLVHLIHFFEYLLRQSSHQEKKDVAPKDTEDYKNDKKYKQEVGHFNSII